MPSSTLSISLISLLATFAVADNLFTDWGNSNLDTTNSDLNPTGFDASSDSLFNSDATDNQLLAYNDNAAPSPFTSDSVQYSSDGLLPADQLSTTPLPDDTSNLFLDTTASSASSDVNNNDLYSFLGNDPAGTDPSGTDLLGSDPAGTDPSGTDLLGSDPFGGDATGSDLLAASPGGGCSAYRPPSRGRKARRDDVCTVGADGNTHPPYGFMEKSQEEQAKIYGNAVCPTEHWPDGAQTPVCSSADPSKSVLKAITAAISPDSMILADSNLCQSSFSHRVSGVANRRWGP